MVSKNVFLLFSILLSMIGTKALAYDYAVENADGVTIYYNMFFNSISDVYELEVARGGYSGSVVIPEEVVLKEYTRKVTRIGEYAFQNCDRLISVTIPCSVTSIENSAFSGCSGLTSITIPSSVTTIGYGAFSWCSGLTSVNIPPSVTNIGDEAFCGCIWLPSITIPNSVTILGWKAFSGCRALTSVTIGNHMTIIGNEAFSNCIRLTSITIPNSVISIGIGVFQGCSSLISVTIGNSVTSIGERTFKDCDLSEVISKIEKPFDIYSNTFSDNTFSKAKLYVPVGTIEKYQTTEGWKEFAFIEERNGGGETNKCEKPKIAFTEGKLIFSCATEGVTYQYNITASDVKNGVGNDIDFTPKYIITVYATKAGYEDSEKETLEVSVSGDANGDLNNDGITNAADVVRLTDIIMNK